MARAIATESLALGVNQLFAPLADLARELRYGRVEECFSEDSYLYAHPPIKSCVRHTLTFLRKNRRDGLQLCQRTSRAGRFCNNQAFRMSSVTWLGILSTDAYLSKRLLLHRLSKESTLHPYTEVNANYGLSIFPHSKEPLLTAVLLPSCRLTIPTTAFP